MTIVIVEEPIELQATGAAAGTIVVAQDPTTDGAEAVLEEEADSTVIVSETTRYAMIE